MEEANSLYEAFQAQQSLEVRVVVILLCTYYVYAIAIRPSSDVKAVYSYQAL